MQKKIFRAEQLYLKTDFDTCEFCVGASSDKTCPVYGAGFVTYGDTFCQ